jgi:hypothetical protein
MPRGDRTGPTGAGSMTGRGLGFCAGNDTPGFATPGFGFQSGGRGRGGHGAAGGRGRRNRFYATGLTGWQRADRGMQAWGGMAPAAAPLAGETPAEIGTLRAQMERLEQQLGDIRSELARLEQD